MREGLLNANLAKKPLTLQEALEQVKSDNEMLDGIPDEHNSVEEWAKNNQYEVKDMEPQEPVLEQEDMVANEDEERLQGIQDDPQEAQFDKLPIYQDGKIVGYEAASVPKTEQG